MFSWGKGIWRYSLFQIPAAILALFLLLEGILLTLDFQCSIFWKVLVWGLIAISFSWTLVLPIDRLLKFLSQLSMNLRGRIAIGNALFWTALMLSLMFARLPPLWVACSADLQTDDSELVSLDWAQWRADIWDEMFYGHAQPTSIPTGTEAEFSFTVTQDKAVKNIKVQSEEPAYEDYVNERILALDGRDALTFIPSTQRLQVDYESKVSVCNDDSSGCGSRAESDNFQDVEEYEITP